MNIYDVQSSNVKRIGWAAAERALYIQFAGGAIYRYAGVGPAKVGQLLFAPSIGKAVNEMSQGRKLDPAHPVYEQFDKAQFGEPAIPTPTRRIRRKRIILTNRLGETLTATTRRAA